MRGKHKKKLSEWEFKDSIFTRLATLERLQGYHGKPTQRQQECDHYKVTEEYLHSIYNQREISYEKRERSYCKNCGKDLS